MSFPTMFSIVVPVYKVEKYLSQCVDSLLSQDVDDYEIILVDDGSPDNCPAICDDYASKNERVKVIHKPNGGLSDARNEGVKASKGKYVTFVDSDDFWKDYDVLSGVAKIISEYHPDIVVSDFIKYYTDSDKYIYPSITCDTNYNGKDKIEILKYLYFCHADMKMSACQKFTERKLLTRHPFTVGLLSEDIDWSLSLYLDANNICVYDKPYYCYRQMREGSITNTASQRSVNSLLHIIDKWEAKICSSNINNREKSIYLGYLAYQLSILMPLSLVLEQSFQHRVQNEIKKHLTLFRYAKNPKTQKVYRLVRLFGVRNTSWLLNKLLHLRRYLQSR